MTQSEVKKHLSAAARAYSRFKAAKDKADTYRAQLTGKAVRYEGVGSSAKINATEEAFQRLIAYDEDVVRCELAWLASRSEVENLIALCPREDERIMLEYRYLCRYKYEDIAAALGCTVRTVYRTHKKAIQFLCNIS